MSTLHKYRVYWHAAWEICLDNIYAIFAKIKLWMFERISDQYLSIAPIFSHNMTNIRSIFFFCCIRYKNTEFRIYIKNKKILIVIFYVATANWFQISTCSQTKAYIKRTGKTFFMLQQYKFNLHKTFFIWFFWTNSTASEDALSSFQIMNNTWYTYDIFHVFFLWEFYCTFIQKNFNFKKIISMHSSYYDLYFFDKIYYNHKHISIVNKFYAIK